MRTVLLSTFTIKNLIDWCPIDNRSPPSNNENSEWRDAYQLAKYPPIERLYLDVINNPGNQAYASVFEEAVRKLLASYPLQTTSQRTGTASRPPILAQEAGSSPTAKTGRPTLDEQGVRKYLASVLVHGPEQEAHPGSSKTSNTELVTPASVLIKAGRMDKSHTVGRPQWGTAEGLR